MNNFKTITFSASQIDTASGCLRQWWLSKVAKAPQPFDPKLLLGDVGHGVCENHLLSKPMYPENWEYSINRWTGQKSERPISPTEQALVKKLVQKAIDEGKLIRHPDQEVEKEFKFPVGEYEGVKVNLFGFIDHFYGNHVDDHKFCKSTRWYGPAKLDKATAMNLYAYAGYEEGFITEPTTWLRYNLFVKDPMKPMVKEVSKEKSKEEIYKFYREHIEPMFKPMILAKRNCSKWSEVDSAMDRGKAKQVCEKYGGCPYLDICLGKVSLERYIARFNEESIEDKKKGQQDILNSLLGTNKQTTTKTVNSVEESLSEVTNKQTPPQEEKESKMNMLADLAKQRAGGAVPQAKAPAPATTPAAPSPKPEAKAEPPAGSAQGTIVKAPWAFESCPQCKVEGVSTGIFNGQPCNICVISTNAAKQNDPNQPVLEDFNIDVGTDGIITWKDKVGKAVVEEKVVEEVTAKEVVESKGGDSFEEPQPEPTQPTPVVDQAPTPKPVEEVKEEPTKKPPLPEAKAPETLGGDPKSFNSERMGFAIAFYPVNLRGRKGTKLGASNTIVTPAEVMEFIEADMLAVANASGAAAKEWMDIDVFKRREQIKRNAKAIAEVIGNSILDASSICPGTDEQYLVEAVYRYASMVIGSMK